jgi:hypothetical protein
MSKNLVPIEPSNLTELKGVAQIFAESGLFKDSKAMAQAFVKIMAGREMGLGAFNSMNNIHIIQGKPSIGAHLMAAKIKDHPSYDYRLVKLENDGCVLEFFELRGGEWVALGESSFLESDAEEAQLLSKPNWQKTPRNMYFARAISNGMRWYCPDVFMQPVYVQEEIGDGESGGEQFDYETGKIIEGNFEEKNGNEENELTPAPAPSNDQPWQEATANWADDDWYPNFYKPTIKLIRGQSKTEVKDSELQALIKHACGVETIKEFKGTRGDLRIHTFRLIQQLKANKPITDPDGKVFEANEKARVSTKAKSGVNHLGRVDAKLSDDDTVILTLYGADDDTGEIDILPLCDHEIPTEEVIDLFQVEPGEISDETTTIYEADFHVETIGIVELKWKRDNKNKFVVVSLEAV